jgi:hypothetical protein
MTVFESIELYPKKMTIGAISASKNLLRIFLSFKMKKPEKRSGINV